MVELCCIVYNVENIELERRKIFRNNYFPDVWKPWAIFTLISIVYLVDSIKQNVFVVILKEINIDISGFLIIRDYVCFNSSSDNTRNILSQTHAQL